MCGGLPREFQLSLVTARRIKPVGVLLLRTPPNTEIREAHAKSLFGGIWIWLLPERNLSILACCETSTTIAVREGEQIAASIIPREFLRCSRRQMHPKVPTAPSPSVLCGTPKSPASKLFGIPWPRCPRRYTRRSRCIRGCRADKCVCSRIVR